MRLLLRSRLSEKGIFVERAEAAFFSVHAPAPPHNSQAGHHRNRKINTEHSGNFASRQDAENSTERMQFHVFAHYSWRDNIILDNAPGSQENQDRQPVGTCKQCNSQNQKRCYQRPDHGDYAIYDPTRTPVEIRFDAGT